MGLLSIEQKEPARTELISRPSSAIVVKRPIVVKRQNKPLRMMEFGRGGGDRKLNLLSQVLSCQRRSTAALLPIGVKWCQMFGSRLRWPRCLRKRWLAEIEFHRDFKNHFHGITVQRRWCKLPLPYGVHNGCAQNRITF